MWTKEKFRIHVFFLSGCARRMDRECLALYFMNIAIGVLYFSSPVESQETCKLTYAAVLLHVVFLVDQVCSLLLEGKYNISEITSRLNLFLNALSVIT